MGVGRAAEMRALLSRANTVAGVRFDGRANGPQHIVVCRPEEALDCFLRTKMDVLVLAIA